MKTLIERLDEEADYSHKAWYRVADEETRNACRALTIEAAARIRVLEAALNFYAKNMGQSLSMDRRVIIQDAGDKARAALATLETKGVTDGT